MRTQVRPFIAAALLVTAFPSAAAAQATGLPNGRAVIDRFIAAIGGRDALEKQSGRRVTGRFEIPAQGIVADLEIHQAPPNRILLDISIPGIGQIRTGYDGTTAWATNPATGPMVLDGLQLEQMKHQADYFSVLYPPTMIADLETVAEEPFEGTPAYKVRVRTTWGEEYFEFFDKATGLQLGSIRAQASPMGDIETTSVATDWKPVDGILMPFRSTQRMMGIEQVIVITTVETMVVPDSVFTLPQEIRALVGK
jgi:hypothetical protein